MALLNIQEPQGSNPQGASPLENAAKILGVGLQAASAYQNYDNSKINQQNADTARLNAMNSLSKSAASTQLPPASVGMSAPMGSPNLMGK